MKTKDSLQFRVSQLNVHWTQYAKKKQQYETDTRKYCSLYDQLLRNVHKCTFPMTNDL